MAAWNAAYEQMVQQVANNGFLDQVVREGAVFPDFMLPSAEGRLVALESVLARGPVVVSFFRGEWCPFCRIMLAALAEELPKIEAAGGTLLALTPETGGLALTMKTFHNARFEVLCDVDFGVGLAAGLNFPERHGNAAWCIPVPATFVLDRDGRVAWRFVDADFSHRAEPADIIAALRQLGAQ